MTEIELQNDAIKEQLKNFDTLLGDKISSLVDNPNVRMQLYREDDNSKYDEPYEEQKEEDAPLAPEMDMHYELLLTEPTLQTMNGPCKAKVIARKRDQDGNVIGKYNPNPMLNTRVCIAEIPRWKYEGISS